MFAGNCIDPQQMMVYFDGELPRDQAAAIEDHLKECPACRRLSAGTHQLNQLINLYPQPTISPRFVQRTFNCATRFMRLRKAITHRMIPAAAAVLLLMLGLRFYVSLQPLPQASAAVIINHEMVENIEVIQYIDVLQEMSPNDLQLLYRLEDRHVLQAFLEEPVNP